MFRLFSDLVRDFVHSSSARRFQHYAGATFTLDRVRSVGAETVFLNYSGPELDGQIEAEESGDRAISINLDFCPALQNLSEATTKQLARNLHEAFAAENIACQIVWQHHVL